MKKVVRFIIKFVNKATADSVPAYAAQVAFFVMLSFFPFMMLLVMIVSKLSVMNTNVLGYILRVVPSGLESYVAYIVDDVVNANVQSFTLITVFVSLWSAAKGIQALSTGLNKIYGVEQNKNYFLVRLVLGPGEHAEGGGVHAGLFHHFDVLFQDVGPVEPLVGVIVPTAEQDGGFGDRFHGEPLYFKIRCLVAAGHIRPLR